MKIKLLLALVAVLLLPWSITVVPSNLKEAQTLEDNKRLFSKQLNPVTKCKEAVVKVTILSTVPFPHSLGNGTGFIVDNKKGLILTAFHVINQSLNFDLKISSTNKVMITLPGDRGIAMAEVIKSNPERDLALLKFLNYDSSRSKALKITDEIYEGQLIFILGYPLDYNFTATAGIISGLNTAISVEGMYFRDLFSSDAVVSPGNSGGPVINIDGKVVGILQYRSEGSRYSSGHPGEYLLSFISDYISTK